MIRIENLTKIYDNQTKKVIDNISFDLPDKGLFFILGKSGSGKTTLLNLLAGIDQPTDGIIRMDEMEIDHFTENEMDELRNKKMGIVFQDFNLVSTLTVYQNVKLALSIQDWDGKCEADISARVMQALQYVGMEAFANRRIQQLSGGEIQRVSIARVLVKNPQLVLADEPTGNLDSKNSRIIFELLKKISAKCLVVAVTHDRESAIKYGDGYYEIVDGYITKAEKLNKPNEVYLFDIEVKNKKKKLEESVELTMQNALAMFGRVLEKCGNEEEDIQVSVSSKKVLTEPKENKEEKLEDRKNIECKCMSKLDLISYAIQNIRRRKVKMAITSVMMLLTFTLLILTTLMTKYDKYQVIENYFEEYKPDYLYPMKEVSYTDSLKETQRKELSSGKELYQILSSDFQKNTGGLRSDILVTREEDEDNLFSQECGMYVYNGILDGYELEGDLPKLSNETAITDYVASILHLPTNAIGKTIAVEGTKVTITGILHTDYTEYGLNDKLNEGLMNNYTQYLYEYKYNIVLVSTNLIKNLKETTQYIYTAGTDLLNSKKERFFTNETTIGNLDLLHNEKLLAGRMPENRNEIVISSSYASDNGFINEGGGVEEDILNQGFTFRNIRDGEFVEYYTDTINMYDFFPEGVEIVGIYEDEGYVDISSPQIYLMKESFSEIREEYYNYYIYDQYFITGNALEYHKITNMAKDNKWGFNDLVVYQILEFNSMISYFSNVLRWLLIVLIVIVILMIYSNVSGSINHNRKMIGILRTLGVTRKDTIKIFAAEALIIYLSSTILSIIGSFSVVSIINYFYRKEAVEFPFNICYFDFLLCFAVVFLCAVVFSVSVLIPLRKFAKQHPIQVIRGDK